MEVLRSIGLLLLVACGVAGCSSDNDDGKVVAGRTRSLARAADPDQVALEGRVRRRHVTARATGEIEASLSASLRVADAAAAVLHLPTGEELTLTPDEVGTAREVELAGTPEQLDARCPDGAYTFTVRLVDGSGSSLTLEVGGPAPVSPTIVAPTDMAIVTADVLNVTWTWTGTAGLFDVCIVDVTTGEVAYRARDLADREHIVPAGALTPARRYRLEVAAVSAASTAEVRLETATTIELDVSSGGAP